MTQPFHENHHDLLALLQNITIAHHIPGRIRLKLRGKLPTWIAENPQAVRTKMTTLCGIVDVKVNPIAASATITYHRSPEIFALFEQLHHGQAEPLLDYLTRRGGAS
ncbi:hypothetical protein [Chrysiogenes arsenatis]|uniref:hypothetical protein n=1 Tax=Chrysiogenes arsenatis TaxID=309797 RepID=UPI000404AACD|nr:hypothetical protein [Chrysiogenes arsenatis]